MLAIWMVAAVNVGALGCGTATLVGGDSLLFDAVAEMWGLTAALLLVGVRPGPGLVGVVPGPLAPHADALITLMAVLTLALPAVGGWSLAAAAQLWLTPGPDSRISPWPGFRPSLHRVLSACAALDAVRAFRDSEAVRAALEDGRRGRVMCVVSGSALISSASALLCSSSSSPSSERGVRSRGFAIACRYADAATSTFAFGASLGGAEEEACWLADERAMMRSCGFSDRITDRSRSQPRDLLVRSCCSSSSGSLK